MGTTELTAIIISACTVVYTIGTLSLWYLTYKNIQLIKQQIDVQSAMGRSAAWHNVIDSHRDLYLEIIKNDELLKLYSEEVGQEPGLVRKKYLATMMINHALRIFLDYSNKLDIPEDQEGYTNDLHSMLNFKFVQERWGEVRNFYPQSFREFIDQIKVAPIVAQ